jgi:hypothetical protein
MKLSFFLSAGATFLLAAAAADEPVGTPLNLIHAIEY